MSLGVATIDYPAEPATAALQDSVSESALPTALQDSAGIVIDSLEPARTRQLEPGWRDAYSGDEFNYQRVDGEAENLLARMLRWFSQWLADAFGVQVPGELLTALEVLIYVLLGILAVYLVVRFVANAPFNSLFSREAKAVANAAWTEEELERADLDALLSEALAKGDYRLAIRYRFLKLLLGLSRGGHIEWHPEKTNSDYLRELTDPVRRHEFQMASRIFEYTWYGEQSLNGEGYRRSERWFGRQDEINTPK